jgi:hypothetical protein
MWKKIILHKPVVDGVFQLNRPFPRRIKTLAFATETEGGIPYMLVFYDGKKVDYIQVKRSNVLDKFLEYLNKKFAGSRPRTANLLFTRKLPYHITAALCRYETRMFKYATPPTLIHPLGSVWVSLDGPGFASIKLPNKRRVRCMDVQSFLRGSLYSIAKELSLKHRGDVRPRFEKSPERRPTSRREWQDTYRRCRSNIITQYELGQFIVRMHRKFDVPIALTSPSFAANVLRKHFIKGLIPQAPPHIRNLAELTMHGGVVGAVIEGPAEIYDVNYYDVNSFYPWALSKLPPFTEGKWDYVDRFVDEYEGFYRVSGYVKACIYPVIPRVTRAGLVFANGERVENLPVTSYELREALQKREVEPTRIEGYVWVPQEGSRNPFKNYVTTFFALKSRTKEEASQHEMYKLLLNSIYGKTYQKFLEPEYRGEPKYKWNPDARRCVVSWARYRAGELYLPHVASLTTAMCRAQMHDLLHKCGGLSFVVDSIMAQDKGVPTGEGLGELKKEIEGGLLLHIRPMLYVLFSPRVAEEVRSKCGSNLKSWISSNIRMLKGALLTDRAKFREHIPKYALHGFFMGDVIRLLRMYSEGTDKYFAKFAYRADTAQRRRKRPRQVVRVGRRVKIF